MGASPASASETLAAIEIRRHRKAIGAVRRCANCMGLLRLDKLEHFAPGIKCSEIVPFKSNR